MMLKKVRIKNFKNFKDVGKDIEFGKLNVLVGANASGKTNFRRFFEFLKHIVQGENPGLVKAINNQCGTKGINYFLNTYLQTRFPFEADIGYCNPIKWNIGKNRDRIVLYSNSENYLVKLKFEEGRIDYNILENRFNCKCGLDKGVDVDERYVKPDELTQREVVLKQDNEGWEYYEVMPDNKLENTKLLQPLRDLHAHWDGWISSERIESKKNNEIHTSRKKILLEGQGLFVSSMKEVLRSISTFDFQHEHFEINYLITDPESLNHEGNNLTLVLYYLLQDTEKKRTLFNLLSYVFPFFKELEIEKIGDNHIQFWMKEKYHKEASIPSFLLSDGTMDIIAIIIVLFLDDSKIVFIEEPDRNLHPYLVSALVELIKDASRNKQIFITTHNPEVLRHVDKEDILLVSRNNDDGFSTITRPTDQEVIKAFLCDELGMPELFIDNLLEMKDGNK
jgi:predicted ATPase